MGVEFLAAMALLGTFAALYGLLPTLLAAIERRCKNKSQ
jgi:hypothetical protein